MELSERDADKPSVLFSNEDALLRDFRKHQQRRGLAIATITGRDRHLRIFGHWLGHSVLTATPSQIEAFLDTRRGRTGDPITARALYCWLSDLHLFYQWAITSGVTVADPTTKLVRPRLRPNLPRPISDRDLETALSAADARVRAMLLAAHLGGARCIEIAQLDRQDVMDEHDPPLVRWQGKGGKHRLVPLHPDLLDALRMLPLPRQGRVFRHPNGYPLTPTEVSKITNTLLHSLGIPDTMHSLRHWFGTAVYAETKDIRVTQELMGHGSPVTTAGYIQFSPDEAARGVNRLRRPQPR